ncbi:MAG: hypothetical protein V1779_04760 [bacterium]
MKRILSIFFISFLILNTFGTIGYYYYQRAGIRTEMKRMMKSNIPKDKIEILKIANNSKYFQRIHEKEFRFKGKMYDVITELPTDEYTIFYCINDEKEEQLMESYSKLFETSIDGMTSVKYSLKILKNIFFPLYFEKENLMISNNFFIIENVMNSDNCIECFFDIDPPPPKIL